MRIGPVSVISLAGRLNVRSHRGKSAGTRAGDILSLYVGPWAYRVLVTEGGWSLDEYEAWLADTLCTQLLAPG